MLGAVLVGGASRRFAGKDKASVIGPHVLSEMRAAAVDPIVAIGGAPGTLMVPTIADRYPGEGPLGAVATATTYARTGWVLTSTCDLALLQATSFSALIDAIDGDRPDTGVVACVDGQPQVSLGCWPARWSRELHQAIRGGERRFRHLLSIGPVIEVEVPARHLADADDRATLDRLWTHREDMPDPELPGA